MKNKSPQFKSLLDKKYWIKQKEKALIGVKNLPKTIFVKYSHSVDVLAVLLVLLLASYLVVNMLKYTPNNQSTKLETIKINVNSLERINNWLEEKTKEQKREIKIEKSKLYQDKNLHNDNN